MRIRRIILLLLSQPFVRRIPGNGAWELMQITSTRRMA
jgi:hypothetical protein